MTNPVWLVFVLMAILLWSTTSLLYKAGARDGNESHICLKNSVCVGMVFYSYAMAMNSVSTDPILAAYPCLP